MADGLQQKDYFFEAGNSGLKVFGGYIVEDYDPTLRGIRGMRALREMADTDPTVGSILFIIGQVIRKISWHFEPADQSLPSLLAQEFFESCMDDMAHTWDEFVAELISMFTYGYAPFEIVLKERKGGDDSLFDDGMIGIKKLGLRAQDTVLRWIFDADNNDVIGMVQIPWTGGIRTIPIEKILLFRTTSTKNNPEGRSILRNSYRPYYFRKRIEEIEAIGVERDLAGLPIMKVPGELIAAANTNSDPAAVASLAGYKQLITNIRRNSQEGVILPSTNDATGKPLFELELLKSGGQRQLDTSKIVDRYTQSIATTVLADFLLLGHSSRGGGQALGTSKVDMFFSAIEGMVQQICSTINKKLVPLLANLNGIPQKYWPKIYTDKAEQVDLGKLGAYINALAASGMQMFPDPDLEQYLRGVAGLPEPSEETQQANEAQQNLDRQAAASQSVAQIHGARTQAMTSQIDNKAISQGKPPPSQMGGGGGAPGKPQGSYGPPRGRPQMTAASLKAEKTPE